MHFQNCQGALLIRVGLSKLTEFICFLCLVRPFLNERREMVRCICIVCEKNVPSLHRPCFFATPFSVFGCIRQSPVLFFSLALPVFFFDCKLPMFQRNQRLLECTNCIFCLFHRGKTIPTEPQRALHRHRHHS